MHRESSTDIYILTQSKTDGGKFLFDYQEPDLEPHDSLEGQEAGGRETQEGRDMLCLCVDFTLMYGRN